VDRLQFPPQVKEQISFRVGFVEERIQHAVLLTDEESIPLRRAGDQQGDETSGWERLEPL
jgi:hypothetical protein